MPDPAMTDADINEAIRAAASRGELRFVHRAAPPPKGQYVSIEGAAGAITWAYDYGAALRRVIDATGVSRERPA